MSSRRSPLRAKCMTCRRMRNDRLDRLAEFPFRRLAALLAREQPPVARTLDLALGEPRHAPPALLAETVAAHAHLWNRYPPVLGTPEFREAVGAWLTRRFDLSAGRCSIPTGMSCPWPAPRRALYLLPSLLTPSDRSPAVLMPDPVYAVYYGGAVMAGAAPVLLPATAATGFLPDLEALSPDLLARDGPVLSVLAGQPAGRRRGSRLSAPRRPPGPPSTASSWRSTNATANSGTGSRRPVPSRRLWRRTAASRGAGVPLAEQAVERARAAVGVRRRRSADLLARLVRLRAYASPVQPLPLLAAATALWRDETHVEANRARYRAKFDLARAGSATASASIALRAASSCGSTSATARRRAAGCGGKRACGSCRGLPLCRARASPTPEPLYPRRPGRRAGNGRRSARPIDRGAWRRQLRAARRGPWPRRPLTHSGGAPLRRTARQRAPARRHPADRGCGGPGRGAVRLRLARSVAEPGDGAVPCTIRPGWAGPTSRICSTSCLASPPGCRCWSGSAGACGWPLSAPAGRLAVVFSLPLALLALAAFFAALPLLPLASWPLRVGLGGALGDVLWRWLEPRLGEHWFAAASWRVACCLGCTTLGVRWAEGIWAAGKVGAGSLWVGRRLGDAAGAATIGSGRLMRDGWRGFDLGRSRRPGTLAPAAEDEVDPGAWRLRRRRC